MFTTGLVDPARVTRSALQNAASIAGMLLTTEALISNVALPRHFSADQIVELVTVIAMANWANRYGPQTMPGFRTKTIPDSALPR